LEKYGRGRSEIECDLDKYSRLASPMALDLICWKNIIFTLWRKTLGLPSVNGSEEHLHFLQKNNLIAVLFITIDDKTT